MVDWVEATAVAVAAAVVLVDSAEVVLAVAVPVVAGKLTQANFLV